MDFVNNVLAPATNLQQLAVKTACTTTLAGICGYAGTFFFTVLNPASAAIYVASAALTSQVCYQVLAKIQQSVQSPLLKQMCTVAQLLQIPLLCYLMPNPIGIVITGIQKLEVLVATAYFVAIPVFFHLAIIACNRPTTGNIVAAVGVLLPLANGLGGYVKTLRAI